jgi:hypothetical protein
VKWGRDVLVGPLGGPRMRKVRTRERGVESGGLIDGSACIYVNGSMV